MNLPRAAQPFVDFPRVLRTHGFAVSPDQTISYLEAIGLLGPRDVGDIRNAGLAMLAIPKERIPEYDALFRAFFLGQTVSAPTRSDDEDDSVEAHDEGQSEQQVDIGEEDDEVGEQASASEALSHREFQAADSDEALLRFLRRGREALPRRRSYRRAPARHGTAFDLKRSLRQAVRRDGEVFDLLQTRRKTRQRRVTLLIDVSGSMQEQSDQTLRFAHALKTVADRAEIFTFGTRLTRITRALSDKNVDRALARVGSLVADFDGGTRIGDALDALLAVPRFAGTMRGALVLILSDGLERGDPAMMVDAVRRISRLAWRLEWLSPLAGDESYTPRTEGLAAALPYIDGLSDGSRIDAICKHVLALRNAA